MEPLLVRLSESVADARTLEDLVRPLLAMLRSVTGLDSAYLTSIDVDAGRLEVAFADNGRATTVSEGLSIALDESLCHRAMRDGRLQADDVPERWPDCTAARALDIQTYVSVPVRAADGALFGTLCAISPVRHVLDRETEHVLRLFSRLIADHVERERLVAELRRLNHELATTALSDGLTGLPNRRALELELARMLARVQRDDRALVVAFIDLDDFKRINDVHGHEAGDRMLVAMARALEATLRGGDLVARIGGDEFVVAGTVPRENAEASADSLRQRLEDATRGYFDLGGGQRVDYRGASVGVELASPGEIDAAALLARADRGMYEAKRGRRASA